MAGLPVVAPAGYRPRCTRHRLTYGLLGDGGVERLQEAEERLFRALALRPPHPGGVLRDAQADIVEIRPRDSTSVSLGFRVASKIQVALQE